MPFPFPSKFLKGAYFGNCPCLYFIIRLFLSYNSNKDAFLYNWSVILVIHDKCWESASFAFIHQKRLKHFFWVSWIYWGWKFVQVFVLWKKNKKHWFSNCLLPKIKNLQIIICMWITCKNGLTDFTSRRSMELEETAGFSNDHVFSQHLLYILGE